MRNPLSAIVPAQHHDQLAHRRIRSGGAIEYYRVYGPDEKVVDAHCYWMLTEYHEDGTHSTLRWVTWAQYQKSYGSAGLDWLGFVSPLVDTKEIIGWIDRANPTGIDCWPPKNY